MRQPRHASGAVPTFTLALADVRQRLDLLEERLETLGERVEELIVAQGQRLDEQREHGA